MLVCHIYQRLWQDPTEIKQLCYPSLALAFAFARCFLDLPALCSICGLIESPYAVFPPKSRVAQFAHSYCLSDTYGICGLIGLNHQTLGYEIGVAHSQCLMEDVELFKKPR